MGIICVAFLFNIWQFTQSGAQRTTPQQAEIPLIPTPSMQTTGTSATDITCESIYYEVNENDTIESIAARFSVPAEEIRTANELRKGNIHLAMKLSIPVCSPTPSGTPNTVTTTFTPLLGPNTLTPVNESTQ
jgi:LysM repeat protein